ncbi:MAG: flavodoxin [Planctomycetota bacterium]
MSGESLSVPSKIGIFYGSDTGNTERIAEMLVERLAPLECVCTNIDECDVDDFLAHEVILFGVSTWNIGEIQCSWEDKLDELKTRDFSGKRVGLFGLGDSAGYPDTFVDGLGILWECVGTERPPLIGVWSKEGYIFDDSRGMFDDDHFLGLVIDEDSEPEYTDERLDRWVAQVKGELERPLQAAG